MKRNIYRREMLKLAGIGGGAVVATCSPLRNLISSILDGVFLKAYGQEMGMTPRNWVDFRLDSAPPRWVYDLILNPEGSSQFVANPHVGTKYVGGSTYDSVEYANYRFGNIHLPWMWQFNLPKADGSMRPMTELLANFMNIRGISVGNPGHVGARQLHYSPIGASQSIPALAADVSRAPLPAVSYNAAQFNFSSVANRSSVNVTGTNLITSLMNGFVSNGSANLKDQRKQVQDYLNAVRAEINRSAIAAHPAAAAAGQAVLSAQELMMRAFGDLGAVWTQLLGKYRGLITRAFDPNFEMAGINDKAIGIAVADRDASYEMDNVLVTNADLRSLIRAQSSVGNMAEAFALAEFVLTRGLSSSMTLGIGNVTGLQMGNTVRSLSKDEHFTGKMVSLIANTYFARAHAACMLEFMDQLKAANLFSNTVINVSGEFNRSPQNSGFGSDHGEQGGSLALYSGCIGSPIIIGNIRADSPVANHTGTWGFGAGINMLGGQRLDLGHSGATIAALLKTASPSARSPLVREVNGRIEPLIETGKIVA